MANVTAAKTGIPSLHELHTYIDTRAAHLLTTDRVNVDTADVVLNDMF